MIHPGNRVWNRPHADIKVARRSVGLPTSGDGSLTGGQMPRGFVL